MFLFTISAEPDPENEEHGEYTHADVSAWINFQELHGAEELARFYIREAGWTPGDTMSSFELAEEAMTEDDEMWEFIVEAREFGHSLLIEAWEEDDEGTDSDEEE